MPPSAANASRERIAGRLLEHGRDAYRHDPEEEPSYFVRVETREGRREIWGKDLERAMSQSLTQPQVGDEVVLQKTGRDLVTVKRTDRDDTGRLVGEKDIETHRNRWVIERSEFFAERAQAAQVVRGVTIDPRSAVRDHPELAGTYLNLRAGELAAQRLRERSRSHLPRSDPTPSPTRAMNDRNGLVELTEIGTSEWEEARRCLSWIQRLAQNPKRTLMCLR